MQVPIADYPQLKALCWQLHDDVVLTGAEALSIYERNWQYVDQSLIGEEERALLDLLVKRHGNGIFLT